MLDDAGEVVLGDSLDDLPDKRVLVKREVLLLDLLVELWAASLSNQECFSRSSTFQGDLCGVLQLTNEQILLDDALHALIPIGIS